MIAGAIEGTIDNISVGGGDPMEEPIHLVKTDFAIGALNTFAGTCRNGPARGAGSGGPTPLTAPGAAVSSATARR